MTNGRGPDRCIDVVGCEAYASSTLGSMIDAIKRPEIRDY